MNSDVVISKTAPGLAGSLALAAALRAALEGAPEEAGRPPADPGIGPAPDPDPDPASDPARGSLPDIAASLEDAPDILVSDLQVLAAAHLLAARLGRRLVVEVPAGGRLDAALRRAGFDLPADARLAGEGARWSGLDLGSEAAA